MKEIARAFGVPAVILTVGAISPLVLYGSKEDLPKPATSNGPVMVQDALAQSRSPTSYR